MSDDDVFGPVLAKLRNPEGDDVFGPVVVKRPRGRQSTFDQEIADTVVDALADGMTLSKIEKLPGVPAKSTLFRWCAAHPEFNIAFHNALRWRTYTRSDEIIEIAEDSTKDLVDETDPESGVVIKVPNKWLLPRVQMRINSLFRVMEKENPKRYGAAPTLLEDVQKPAAAPEDSAAKTSTADPEQLATVTDQLAIWRKAAAGD